MARIACVMGTYGRYHLACEALACFLQQTALEDATMVVLNQHPIPLHFDHPRVTVYNEQMPFAGVRKVRIRLAELADPGAEFIHWWDDDDLYLPWHLEDCLANIGSAKAWKPKRSWMLAGDGYVLRSNSFEASTMFNAANFRAMRNDIFPRYMDHPAFWELQKNKEIRTTELGDLASYLYRWSTGAPHYSSNVRDTQIEYDIGVEELRKNLLDVGPTEMVLPDLWPRWQHFLDGIESQVSPENFNEIQARLAVADAMAKFGAGGRP